MKLPNFKIFNQNIWLHFIFWISLVLVINIIFRFTITRDVIVEGKKVPFTFEIRIIRVLLIGLLFKMALFYINLKWLSVFLSPVTLTYKYFLFIFITATVLFFTEQSVIDWYYKITNRITNGSIRKYLIRVNVLIYVLIIAASLINHFIQERINLTEQQAKLKSERLETQLRLLNNQINPHFLFNTLNNFYALAEEKNNPELAKSIACLSDLLRYSLYESSAHYVLLEKEIGYLRDYINLYRLRFAENDNISVNCNVEINDSDVLIAPMLFVPMLENAFKHGIHINQPSFINITIKEDSSQIFCSVVNSNHSSINKSTINTHSGIGLQNLRLRLKLLYEFDHQLDILETKDEYTIYLTLKKNYA